MPTGGGPDCLPRVSYCPPRWGTTAFTLGALPEDPCPAAASWRCPGSPVGCAAARAAACRPWRSVTGRRACSTGWPGARRAAPKRPRCCRTRAQVQCPCSRSREVRHVGSSATHRQVRVAGVGAGVPRGCRPRPYSASPPGTARSSASPRG